MVKSIKNVYSSEDFFHIPRWGRDSFPAIRMPAIRGMIFSAMITYPIDPILDFLILMSSPDPYHTFTLSSGARYIPSPGWIW